MCSVFTACCCQLYAVFVGKQPHAQPAWKCLLLNNSLILFHCCPLPSQFSFFFFFIDLKAWSRSDLYLPLCLPSTILFYNRESIFFFLSVRPDGFVMGHFGSCWLTACIWLWLNMNVLNRGTFSCEYWLSSPSVSLSVILFFLLLCHSFISSVCLSLHFLSLSLFFYFHGPFINLTCDTIN